MNGRETDALQEAKSCLNSGDLKRAREMSKELLSRNSRNLTALEILAAAAFQDAQYEEAKTFLSRCIRLKPRDSRYMIRMAQINATEGAFNEALMRLEKAEKADPRHGLSPGLKASLLRITGQEDSARILLEPLILAGREDAEMAHEFAQLEIKAGRCDQAIEIAARHLDDVNASISIHRQLNYVIAKAHDKLDRIDDAFAAYQRANSLGAKPFDAEKHVAFIDRLIETFSAERLAVMLRAGSDSELPVFIAGMPRSGTSLIEQIIDAHPSAHGGGELPDFTRLVRNLPEQIGSTSPFPECGVDLDESSIRRVAKPYLSRLTKLGRRARRVVNKNLDNHLYIGLIHVLFPKAKIIHSKRDPLDTCFSCYATHLLPENQPYASDLAHLGLAHRHCDRLMDHWKQVAGIAILEMQYEDLVNDQEAQSKRIIEFLGLEWDDRCLRYYETGRIATTLSHDQVNRPIYSSSIGRHERYGDYLHSLVHALSD